MKKTRNIYKNINIILRALILWGPFFVNLSPNSFNINYNREKIVNFESFINILPDGTLDITEKITVNSFGNQIKRGIIREFPLKYKDNYKNKYNVKFKLISILKDNNPETYKQVYKNNGVYIYIGDKNIYLKPGLYTYQINYKTGRQLGFFKNFDELYWNVTGNGWRLPIEQASVTVILPQNIQADKIKFEGYTGKFGEKEQDFKVNFNNNKIKFNTTKEILPGEGLTIVVTWPKGFIKEPGYFQKLIWLLQDNLNILISLLALILVLILGIFFTVNFRKTQKHKTVIPLFYPPENLSPSATRYIYQKKYDAKTFAALIVDLAFKGYLKIKQEQTGWIYSEYSLLKIKDLEEDLGHNNQDNNINNKIFKRLFKNSSKVTVSKLNSETLSNIINIHEEILSKKFKLDYFEDNFDKVSLLWLTGIILSIFSVFINLEGSFIPFIILGLIIVICSIFSYLLSGYTPEGINIIEKIEGFKLFLKTTEEYRFKTIGTPPDKNPELYEKYLPYAIALGVEKEWSNKFAPIFEQLKTQGRTYTPIWYLGGPGFIFEPNRFSNNFSSSISQSISTQISSSGSRPGDSSGSGGSGSSGGGSGGGGGGGW